MPDRGVLDTAIGEGTLSFETDGALKYTATGKSGDAPAKPYYAIHRKLPAQ